MDPCEYSTQLITCLAEEGSTNCADWPSGSLPFWKLLLDDDIYTVSTVLENWMNVLGFDLFV